MDIIFLIKTYKFKTQTSQQILGLLCVFIIDNWCSTIYLLQTKLSLDVMISFQINRM